MSDTPRTDAAVQVYYDTGQSFSVVEPELSRQLERELNEANADRLRLRTLLAEIGKGDWRYIENGQAFIDINQALTTPPPPVVAKADADALATILVAILSARSGPHGWVVGNLSLYAKQAEEALKTYHAKYPKP